MYCPSIQIFLFAGVALADVLTTIDGNQCTLRSSVVPIITGASRTGSPLLPTTTSETQPIGGSLSSTNGGGSPVTSSEISSIPSPTSTTTSATPATPLPGPVSTNADGIPVYSDRSVCGSIFQTDSTDFYAIYCNAAVVSNTILKTYSMNSDLSPVTIDQCVVSCSLVSNPTVPNGRCEGAVFYNGTNLPSPLCNLYGAATNNKRDTEDSSLSLVYALDSYAALPMSSVDSDIPPAPNDPYQSPSPGPSTSQEPSATPSPTVSASPVPSNNGTAKRFAMDARSYEAPKHVLLDIAYDH